MNGRPSQPRCPAQRWHALLPGLSLVVAAVLLAAGGGAPAAAQPATGTPPVASDGTPLVPVKDAAPSAMGASRAAAEGAGAGPTNLTATAEATRIQQAIEAYNRQNPREPIIRLDEDAIYRLVKYGFLDKPPANPSAFVMVEGRVLERTETPKPPPDPPPPPPTNLGNSFLVVGSEQLTEVDPNTRKPIDPNRNDLEPAFEIIERTVAIRAGGNTIYVPVRVPRIRVAQPRKFPITAPAVRPVPTPDRLSVEQVTGAGKRYTVPPRAVFDDSPNVQTVDPR